MIDLIDRHAGLVGVEHGFFGQDLHQPLFIRFQRGVLLLPGGLQGRFADGIAEHLGAHLADPPAGSLLGVVEVGQQRAEVFPVLDGSLTSAGKGAVEVCWQQGHSLISARCSVHSSWREGKSKTWRR